MCAASRGVPSPRGVRGEGGRGCCLCYHARAGISPAPDSPRRPLRQPRCALARVVEDEITCGRVPHSGGASPARPRARSESPSSMVRPGALRVEASARCMWEGWVPARGRPGSVAVAGERSLGGPVRWGGRSVARVWFWRVHFGAWPATRWTQGVRACAVVGAPLLWEYALPRCWGRVFLFCRRAYPAVAFGGRESIQPDVLAACRAHGFQASGAQETGGREGRRCGQAPPAGSPAGQTPSCPARCCGARTVPRLVSEAQDFD